LDVLVPVIGITIAFFLMITTEQVWDFVFSDESGLKKPYQWEAGMRVIGVIWLLVSVSLLIPRF
jgi:hypothetical protein